MDKHPNTPEIDRIFDQFWSEYYKFKKAEGISSPLQVLNITVNIENTEYVFELLNFIDRRSKAEWQTMILRTASDYSFYTERKFKHPWGMANDTFDDTYGEQISSIVWDLITDLSETNQKLETELRAFDTYCAIEDLK